MKISPPHYFKPQGSPSRGCEGGAFGEKPSAAAREVRFKVLWGAKWTFIPSPLPRQRNSLQTSKENTYICIFRTWKLHLAVDLSPLFFPGKSRVERPCCQTRRCAVGESVRWRLETLDRGAGAERYAISALVSFACIIHATPTNYLGLAPSKRWNVVDLLEGIFSLSHHAAQSRLHPKDVSSPFWDTLKLRLLIFSWLAPNAPHKARIDVDGSIPALLPEFPQPYMTFCFGFAFLSIPLISLQMRNYLITARGVEKWPNVRPVKPNGLCHCDVCFCFLLQITSGIHGRFKAQMRTKGCGTISTLSSCSIDPHMGHGPPLLSPCSPPCMAWGLYLSSHFTIPESGLNKSIISCSLHDSIADRGPFKESMFFSKSKQLNVPLKWWKLVWLTARGVAISHPTEGRTLPTGPMAVHLRFILRTILFIFFFFICDLFNFRM